MNKILVFVLIFCAEAGSAQQKALVDSLRNELKTAQHDSTRIKIMKALGAAYVLSKPDSAYSYAREYQALARKIGDKENEANAFRNLGAVNRELGNLSLAMEQVLQSVAMVKAHHNRKLEMKCLNAVGVIYLDMQDYPMAVSCYKQALRIADSIRDLNTQFSLMTNLGGVYTKIKKLDSAAYYLDRAGKTNAKISKKLRSDTYFLRNQGSLETELGHYEKALSYYGKALSISFEEEDYRNQASIYNKIAKVFELQDQPDSAIKFASKGLAEAQKGPFRIMILEATTLLSLAYEKKSDFKKAFEFQKLKEKTQEELFGTNNIKSIQEAVFKDRKRIDEIRSNQQAYQNKLKQYAFISGLCILLIAALLLYRNNRLKQKSNNSLNTALDELKATQSQLIQAEKMASLGELTAGIAHEIQNPLNFVNNFSDVSNELVDEILDERRKTKDERDEALVDEILSDIKQNLQKINHHGKRADGIVKGMLQHSRASSGEKELTDLNVLADEYLRLAYHGMRAKDRDFNATLETDFDASVGKINVIPQDVGRVILNLITNAFYAVDERQKSGVENYAPTVSVSTRSENGKIILSVRDNGNGIPSEIKDKIFQPFFTTKPTGQGTGLGLSLVYDIVKAHAGELKVDSHTGEGTEFTISLSK